ncbi:MAG: PAS domain-containing protein [Minisyncoccia bacterium]
MNTKHFLKRLFLNYIYSGKAVESALGRQVSFINSFSLIGIVATFGFGMYRILIHDPNGLIEIIFGGLCLLNILYLRKSFNIERASEVLLLLMIGIITFLFVDGGIAGTGLYWVFTFPILAFFLFDDRTGLRWNIGLFLVLIFLFSIKGLGVIEIDYEPIVLRQAFFSFMAQVGLLYFYTKFSGINAQTLLGKKNELEESFDMKKIENAEWAHHVQRALKEKLDIFFQTSGDLMCIANKEGYFLEVNSAFSKMLGYPTGDILKTPFIEFVHPDDKNNTNQVMGSLIQGGTIENFINRYRRSDGTYTWFSWNAVPHEGVFYAIAHNIDSIMVIQEKLQTKVAELEKLNRLMVDRELAMIEMKKELATLRAPKSE